MWHSRSSWKRPVLSVHSSSHASVAFVCRHHWPYIDICVHLFTCTLCCACRIVLLDCTLIIALEREHSQCVVCVQSRCFFSPLLQRELWTPWLYAGGRTVVYLSLYATPEEIMFTWSSAELWHQNNEVVSWRQLWLVWNLTSVSAKRNRSIKSLTI